MELRLNKGDRVFVCHWFKLIAFGLDGDDGDESGIEEIVTRIFEKDY